jgi:cytochrome c biogenesis protein
MTHTDSPTKTPETSALSFWSLFSSMKTAIVLLLAAAGSSVIGTLVKQNASPQEYVASYGRVGYAVIRSLGLDDVYHSGWYLLLLFLLAINLVVCSIRRFSSAWNRTFAPKVVVEPHEISGAQELEKIITRASIDEVGSTTCSFLRRVGYWVKTERTKDSLSLYAIKGRLGIWGPYLTHLSILVVFVGVVVGGFFGSRGLVKIAEGESIDSYWVGSERVKLGFTIALRKFSILTDAKRRPTAYQSHVEVYDGGRLKTRKIIDVNYPLVYKGFAFYQSDCGLEDLILRIKSPAGKTSDVRLELFALRNPEDLLKSVEIDGKKLLIYIHNVALDYVGGKNINASEMPLNPACDILITDKFHDGKKLSTWTRLGWLKVGDMTEYNGYRIELAKAIDYTILEVSKNPGLPIVYAGFGLIVLGVFLSFYVRVRIIRLHASQQDDKTNVVMGCNPRNLDEAVERDVRELCDVVGSLDNREER